MSTWLINADNALVINALPAFGGAFLFSGRILYALGRETGSGNCLDDFCENELEKIEKMGRFFGQQGIGYQGYASACTFLTKKRAKMGTHRGITSPTTSHKLLF